MNKYGIIRRIDNLGRICIPKEIMRTLNLKPGDCFILYPSVRENNVLLEVFREEEEV